MNEVRLKIPDDVREILRRSKIEGDVLALPEQLDRATYVRVDKVLKALGGKWDRKAGWHTFPDGTGARIEAAIADGSVVDRKKTLQLFETPEELAAEMIEHARVTKGSHVLEPNGGLGRLARAAARAGGHVTVVEIDRQNVETMLKDPELQGVAVWCADFFDWAADHAGGYKFDAIVMNPPFANLEDTDHVKTAWGMLKPGGRLVAITSPGWTFHQTAKAAAFRAFAAANHISATELPAGTFSDSGTAVRSMLLIGEKPIATQDSPPTEDRKRDLPVRRKGGGAEQSQGKSSEVVSFSDVAQKAHRHDGGVVLELPVGNIEPDPDQPRKSFPEAELRELASSIRETGLVQPITVREVGPNRFYVVCGERRWRAHRIGGMETIRAIVQAPVDDTTLRIRQIVENDQRQDVPPLEQARSYQNLIDANGWDVPTLARKLGKAPHRIEERLALLRLRDDHQQLLACGQLKPSEAYEISRHDTAGQTALFQMVKAGQCKTYADLRVASEAIVAAAAQTTFDLSASAPPPPTRQQMTDAGIFEMHVARISVLLREGVKDNEIEAVKLVNPNKAAHFADLFQAMQVDMRRIEVALRTVAAQQALKLAKEVA